MYRRFSVYAGDGLVRKSWPFIWSGRYTGMHGIHMSMSETVEWIMKNNKENMLNL